MKPSKSKLDTLWAKRVKERDKFRCKLCGKTEALNSHHILHKKSYRLRYSLDNGITLCVGCHFQGIHSADMMTADHFSFRIKESIGEARYRRLQEMKLDTRKYTLQQALEDLT